MATKQQTANKAPSTAAPAAVVPEAAPVAVIKKARKPKAPSMSIKTKFDVMTKINHFDDRAPDATVAAVLTSAHGHPISELQVRKYREALGLASVGKPKHANLVSDLAAANARIAELESDAAGQRADAGANPEPAGLTD